jgi:hypothetical protein
MQNQLKDIIDWDQLLDPHHDAVEAGRKEGFQSGLESGFQDGFQLGKVKALEIGIELGYMKSIAQQALDDLNCHDMSHMYRYLDTDEERKTKLNKKIEDILQSIEQFPSPDYMFSRRDDDNLNIADDMQRIRAKFKVLLVQLKLPHSTLKKVMNETMVFKKDGITDQEW